MSRRTIVMTDALQKYLETVGVREPAAFTRLREETAALEDPDMQIAPEQGQFMHLLVQAVGARRAIEVGTFTGYSSLWIASALPADGRLLCCDVSKQWTDIARRYWQETGLAERIELRLAPAVKTLDKLLANGGAGAFDFAFVDAEKEEYDDYYERVLKLLRPGGLMLFDNALSDGRVAAKNVRESDARALDALNRKAHEDERVTICLVPIADGLLIARKR